MSLGALAATIEAQKASVVSCYQYGKPGWPTPSDFTREYDGGVADAQTALRLHAAAGVRIRHRSSSASTRTWKSRRGKALQSSGFEESTLYWAWSAPVSMDTPGYVRGPSKMA